MHLLLATYLLAVWVRSEGYHSPVERPGTPIRVPSLHQPSNRAW